MNDAWTCDNEKYSASDEYWLTYKEWGKTCEKVKGSRLIIYQYSTK